MVHLVCGYLSNNGTRWRSPGAHGHCRCRQVSRRGRCGGNDFFYDELWAYERMSARRTIDVVINRSESRGNSQPIIVCLPQFYASSCIALFQNISSYLFFIFPHARRALLQTEVDWSVCHFHPTLSFAKWLNIPLLIKNWCENKYLHRRFLDKLRKAVSAPWAHNCYLRRTISYTLSTFDDDLIDSCC